MAAFSAKVTLEYQMPTISAVSVCVCVCVCVCLPTKMVVLSQKLKTTNECILSSLNGLCGAMDQVWILVWLPLLLALLFVFCPAIVVVVVCATPLMLLLCIIHCCYCLLFIVYIIIRMIASVVNPSWGQPLLVIC